MANPLSVLNGQNQALDEIVDADGVVYLKAAGTSITVTGADAPSAPQLVTDFTLLTGTGAQVVAAGPTRTKLLASATPCRRITVKALVGNTHVLYVGLSNVTADTTNGTGGFQLEPNEAFTFGIDDVSKVYIHGTAAEGASFAYEL
jgi:hypothetical protein